MEQINSAAELRAAINDLERKHKADHEALKEKFHLTYESIKPINIIKHTLREAVESFDLKENMLITAAGISTGFLSEKFVVGDSKSPLRKLIGAAAVFGVTNYVATHPEAVKRVGRNVLRLISSFISTEDDELESEEGISEETEYA